MVHKKMLTAQDSEINLNALRNKDAFAKKILDSALRVAIYKFLSKKNEWQKLDVEGSLFVFERMFEPLHSIAVMNTLALDLFLQPLTYDIEFQDRNPFLLYKSNNDIFGIWFIDSSDCERIKVLLTSLTDQAKERRVIGSSSKQEAKLTLEAKLNELVANSTSNGSSSNQLSKLLPASVDSTTTTSSTFSPGANLLSSLLQNNNANQVSSTLGGNNVDIVQMLAKANMNFIQAKAVDVQNGNSSSANLEQPKPFGNWPNDYHLNSKTYFKPEPIRIQQQQQLSVNSTSNTTTTSIVSPTSSTSSSVITTNSQHSKSQQQQSINPIIQRLLSFDLNTTPVNSTTTTITNSVSNDVSLSENSELISLDLKRKLNILKPIAADSTTALITPNTLQQQQSFSQLMTVKDFEANLLNEQQQQQPMFYLDQSFSNSRPNKLTINDLNENNAAKYQQQRSSNSESSHDSVSSPVLLTPAAFESTTQTSQSFFGANALIMTSNMNDNNALHVVSATSTHPTATVVTDNSNHKQNHNLNKNQLQETLIYLLKNDEQFLNTIHNAYTSAAATAVSTTKKL